MGSPGHAVAAWVDLRALLSSGPPSLRGEFPLDVWDASDILSSFEHLEEYMKVGLNVAMSGIPWWSCDIGGFITHDNSSPRFHELMVRWYQYAAFTPVFRTHGRRPNNEAWTIGGDSYPHIRAAMLLRERLRPYIMEQMKLASEEGLPPMRPVFFDFAAGTAVISSRRQPECWVCA